MREVQRRNGRGETAERSRKRNGRRQRRNKQQNVHVKGKKEDKGEINSRTFT
jgi:hypothetical protein